jgi:DNA-binding winged helix-turn-helix (wHTH) protein
VSIAFGPFTLDESARQLSRHAEPVHLSPKAFDLLVLLVHRRPNAVAKSEILETLWRDTFVSEGNLAVLIKEIRDALGDAAQRPSFVRTVQRFGYAFTCAAVATRTRFSSPCCITWGTHRATLITGENVLGRDPAGDVVVDTMGVSRRHAMIAVTVHDATLTDLGSKNGTFANGTRVTTPIRLDDGVEIRLGPVPLRFHRLADVGSTHTLDTSRVVRVPHDR